MLAKSKLNSIETLISRALIDMEISHEEFITILKEKDKYERMKDKLRSENEKYKIMRLSRVKSFFKKEYACFSMHKIESYCLKCKKNTENIDPKISSPGNGKSMVLSYCAICSSKKSRFIKHQEAKGLLSKLGIKTPLRKVPILGDILF